MYEISIVIDEIIDALGNFIQPFVGEAEIVRAQVNRVAPPTGPYVELTEILSVDLSVPYQDYADDLLEPVAILTGRVRSDIQVDFYGPSSGDWSRVVQNALRTTYGFDKFPPSIKPLYTTDGFQHPWASGEQQSLTRWTLTVTLQYNPQVSVPQEFANELTVNVKTPVDEV